MRSHSVTQWINDQNQKGGAPGLLSGGVSAFGSGRDPGFLGWSPASGSPQGACFSLCLCLCLSLSLSLSLCVSHE